MTTRRDFLRVTALASGGLLLGVSFGCGAPADAAGAPPAELGLFVRLHDDGRVTILAPKIEMGQGTFTAIPMLLADELDLDWSMVAVEWAPLDPRFGWQGAGGSTSVWSAWEGVRGAGAAARAMLRAAAAGRWGVPVGEVTTDRGRVHHAASGRSLAYGAIAAEAAAIAPPDNPELKEPKAFTLIGRATRQVGLEPIVEGREVYSFDTREDGMLRVVVARAPFDGRITRMRHEAALDVPGVRRVVRLSRAAEPSIIADGVAVAADSTWAALTGRRSLEIEMEPGGDAVDGATLLAASRRALDAPGTILRNDGNVDLALARAARVVEADYELPMLAHAPMEPGSCFVRLDPDRATVRGPFQDPNGARDVVAAMTSLDPTRVTLLPARLGGAFGRRLTSDYAAEAVALAREIGAPVHVVWTREDDVQFDVYRPATAHRLRAGLDAAGRLVAWHHRKASTPIAWSPVRPRRDAHHYEIYPDDPPAGLLEHYRVEYTPIEHRLPLGTWRSVIHSVNGFVIGAFLDEVAHAARRDRVAFEREFFNRDDELPYADHGGPVFSPARYRRVLELAADRAEWGRSVPVGRGIGIAAHFTFGSYIAQVAEVSVGDDGDVRVHRVVAAIDCGTPVNPSGIEAQVESGIVYGLSAALYGDITIERGRVRQSNFHDYPVLRMDRMPRIEVHIVPSGAPPRGTGETATPPIAAAVANAIHASTGIRLRRPPFTADRLRRALAAR